MNESEVVSAGVNLSQPSRVTVYIEYWINCESHQWCTNHVADKYLGYLNQVKNAINEQVPECTVIENDLPPEKSERLIRTYNSVTWDTLCKYKSKKGGKSAFPRVGAFEIYIKHKTIFSKLKNGMWPHSDKIAAKIRAIVDNLNEGKPLLKDIQHKDMSESEPEETPRELPNPKSSFVIPRVAKRQRKKKTRKFRRNNKELANQTAYPITESSEERLEPKGVNVDKGKVMSEEDEYANDFEDDDPQKNQDSDDYGDDDDFVDDDENKKEESKVPQDEKVKRTPKKKIRVRNNANKGSRAKYNTNKPTLSNRIRTEVTSAKYSSKPQKSKIALFNSRVATNLRGNRDRVSKNRSQIKHYQNLNRSAHAGKKSRPRTFGNKSHLYSSDHANSFTNLHANTRPKRRFRSSHRQRRPLSSRRVDRKPKEQEVLITKTYDLSLNIDKSGENPSGTISKKISYINKDDQESIFTVKSSHPDQMTFKNAEIIVGAGEKAKFGIRFKAVSEPKLAQYVLFLSKDGNPHENILLNVKYE